MAISLKSNYRFRFPLGTLTSPFLLNRKHSSCRILITTSIVLFLFVAFDRYCSVATFVITSEFIFSLYTFCLIVSAEWFEVESGIKNPPRRKLFHSTKDEQRNVFLDDPFTTSCKEKMWTRNCLYNEPYFSLLSWPAVVSRASCQKVTIKMRNWRKLRSNCTRKNRRLQTHKRVKIE